MVVRMISVSGICFPTFTTWLDLSIGNGSQQYCINLHAERQYALIDTQSPSQSATGRYHTVILSKAKELLLRATRSFADAQDDKEGPGVNFLCLSLDTLPQNHVQYYPTTTNSLLQYTITRSRNVPTHLYQPITTERTNICVI
jgi:hypothetical protein